MVLGADIFGLLEESLCFTRMSTILEVPVTDCFSSHFHSYEVSKQQPKEYVICEQSQLDHTALAAYSVSDMYHIPLKYQLVL